MLSDLISFHSKTCIHNQDVFFSKCSSFFLEPLKGGNAAKMGWLFLFVSCHCLFPGLLFFCLFSGWCTPFLYRFCSWCVLLRKGVNEREKSGRWESGGRGNAGTMEEGALSRPDQQSPTREICDRPHSRQIFCKVGFHETYNWVSDLSSRLWFIYK